MPKAARIRHGKHHASVKLPQAPAAAVDDAQSLNLSNLEDGSISLAQAEPVFEPHVQQSKKAKQIEKREAFLQKLEPSTRQGSKSHQRRLKRKAKEQLTGGLDDLQSALVSLEQDAIGQEESLTTISSAQDETKSKTPIKPGTIGKSGSSTLSKAQRKRVLELERLRHPLILTNSEFSSNPFQTIRIHAQNTLLAQPSQK